ncbi:MAG TPA: NAD(P)/FAD-dependent oxidoreductase [Gammaproteobacteria bacterium]|nr:NAD(P)/FAD-dependent oxidoreductase [Gammaproteobacteria bacterium]
MSDLLVIGGGPAGVAAALRAADLGANTTLVTRDEFGGMAANDGPIPVRTLAHAARLLREARQLERYGITASGLELDYSKLLTRVREVVAEARAHAAFREQIDAAGAVVHERAGAARFVDAHTLETASGLRLRADKIVICTGGKSRKLDVPGAELTATHSDAWALKSVPASMLVIGAGATGAQVASIFNGFGTKVQLFQSGPRIIPTEDEDVSAAVAATFRASGITVREGFGTIESFQAARRGVRMSFVKDGRRESAEAELAVVAVGWTAETEDLNLNAAGVETNARGFIDVDSHLRTSASHIFAAGDVTGRLMLVPQALQDGFIAATNAVLGPQVALEEPPAPIGSFTDPEYAQVGLTEARARARHDVAVSVARFDAATRTIIDGRTTGFCKLIVERDSGRILGCHVVGERAVDIAQLAAVAMSARMSVDALARVPLSFPTHAGILGRAAARAARELTRDQQLRAS